MRRMRLAPRRLMWSVSDPAKVRLLLDHGAQVNTVAQERTDCADHRGVHEPVGRGGEAPARQRRESWQSWISGMSRL